jgi:hypothetical protein
MKCSRAAKSAERGAVQEEKDLLLKEGRHRTGRN